jgi:SpoVK/Ycf46/Vps4 family AAA+-type ATPase
MHTRNIYTYDDNLIGGLLKYDYFKLGKELRESRLEEELFLENNKDLIGFGIDYDTKTLQMFAETYELISSTKKGLLSIDGHFSCDTAPFEYVFDLGDGFFCIFYTLCEKGGTDYRYKVSIVKKEMTQPEAINIIKKLAKDYVNHRKIIQESLFRKGEKVLDDVILPNKLKQSMLKDFKNFLKSRKKYKEFGMIWKRGYIFHGPPGNGKTLFVRKLGPAFGLNMTDISSRIAPDGSLSLPQYADPYDNGGMFDLGKYATGEDDDNPPEIYYLEDMEKVIGKNENDFAKITLSNFLTALDGVSRLANGLIILGTTNNKDCLENSILGRPGRFDRVYEFPKPEQAEILKFFERKNFLIEDKKVTGNFTNLMVEKGFSMAFVEDFVLTGATQVGKHVISLSQAESIMEDLQHYNKLEAKAESIGFGK